jgi:hypothetical protein
MIFISNIAVGRIGMSRIEHVEKVYPKLKSEAARQIIKGNALAKIIRSQFEMTGNPEAGWHKDWDFLLRQLMVPTFRPTPPSAEALLERQEKAGEYYVLDPVPEVDAPKVRRTKAEVEAYIQLICGDGEWTGKQCMSYLPRDGRVRLFGNPNAYQLGVVISMRAVNYLNERFIYHKDAYTMRTWQLDSNSAQEGHQKFPTHTLNKLREKAEGSSSSDEDEPREYTEINGGLQQRAISAILIHPPEKSAKVSELVRDEAYVNAIYRKKYMSILLGRVLPIIIVDADDGIFELGIEEQDDVLERCRARVNDEDQALLKSLLDFNAKNPKCEVEVNEHDKYRKDVTVDVPLAEYSTDLMLMGVNRARAQEAEQAVKKFWTEKVVEKRSSTHEKSRQSPSTYIEQLTDLHDQRFALLKEQVRLDTQLSRIFGDRSFSKELREERVADPYDEATAFLSFNHKDIHRHDPRKFVGYFQSVVKAGPEELTPEIQKYLITLLLKYVYVNLVTETALFVVYFQDVIVQALQAGDLATLQTALLKLIDPSSLLIRMEATREMKYRLMDIREYMIGVDKSSKRLLFTGRKELPLDQVVPLVEVRDEKVHANLVRLEMYKQLNNIFSDYFRPENDEFTLFRQALIEADKSISRKEAESETGNIKLGVCLGQVKVLMTALIDCVQPFDGPLAFLVRQNSFVLNIINFGRVLGAEFLGGYIKTEVQYFKKVLDHALQQKSAKIEFDIYREVAQHLAAVDTLKLGLNYDKCKSFDSRRQAFAASIGNLERGIAADLTLNEIDSDMITPLRGICGLLLASKNPAEAAGFEVQINVIITGCLGIPSQDQQAYIHSRVEELVGHLPKRAQKADAVVVAAAAARTKLFEKGRALVSPDEARQVPRESRPRAHSIS